MAGRTTKEDAEGSGEQEEGQEGAAGGETNVGEYADGDARG